MTKLTSHQIDQLDAKMEAIKQRNRLGQITEERDEAMRLLDRVLDKYNLKRADAEEIQNLVYRWRVTK